MINFIEPIFTLVVVFIVISPILYFRYKFMKRFAEASESIAQSLNKIAETQSKTRP